jgi:hypothetical protein
MMSEHLREIAEQFHAAIPPALSLDTLTEYGVQVSLDQSQQITREMLSLSLYWIHSALKAHLPANITEQIFGELQQRIGKGWESEWRFQEHDLTSYWMEMKQRLQSYDQMVHEGGAPPSLYLEAAALLESAQVIQADDRQKLLALFIDLIPIETFGELAGNLRLADESGHQRYR